MATDLFRDVLDDPTTLQNAAGATGNGTSLDVRGYPTAVVQVTGSSPVGTITFEGTVDGTNFVSVEAVNIATRAVSTTTSAVGVYLLPVAGFERIRARISAFTSGTWTAVARGILADTAAALVAGTSAVGSSLLPVSSSVLASVARTTNQTQADQTNSLGHRGFHLVVDVTVNGAGGSITPKVQAKDANGIYYDLLVGTAITTTGTTVLKLFPGAAPVTNGVADDQLGVTYRVVITANNANSVTYSVALVLLP